MGPGYGMPSMGSGKGGKSKAGLVDVTDSISSYHEDVFEVVTVSRKASSLQAYNPNTRLNHFLKAFRSLNKKRREQNMGTLRFLLSIFATAFRSVLLTATSIEPLRKKSIK